MRKILVLLMTVCVMASCGDSNTHYVKKAVRIMDKNGIYAQGSEWEKAKEEALSAQPSSLEKSVGASSAQVLCGVALKRRQLWHLI